MTATVSTFPKWKKDSTPGEWLSEMSGLALENPDKFGRIAIVVEKLDENGYSDSTITYTYKIPTNVELISVLECAKLNVWEFMKGRK